MDTLSLEEVLESPDIVIIATNHKDFKKIAPEIKESRTKMIYDVWSMFKRDDFSNDQNYLRFGEGTQKL